MLNLNTSFTNEIIFRGFMALSFIRFMKIAKELTSDIRTKFVPGSDARG